MHTHTAIHKQRTSTWFSELCGRVCQTFTEIDQNSPQHPSNKPPAHFQQHHWRRPTENQQDGGGGTMNILRGRVFEKVGVNVSTVYGTLSEEFRTQIPGAQSDGRFWASGISVVAHLWSPHIPAVHFNTRYIITTKTWFGGGTDLTPIYPNHYDTQNFHNALKKTCNKFSPLYYPQFKKYCDQYFYLPHRQTPRGVGGIFFDNLNTQNWEQDFKFVKAIGETFLFIYPQIVQQNLHKTWTNQQREYQLTKRGHYVEFNLLYDRGTVFGLKTNGYTDAILMSLPPEVRWP